MRVSLHRWAMATLMCGLVSFGAGCKGGASSQPAGGWLSWGKKQDSAAALAAARPSTQTHPSPAQTVGNGSALTANGAPGAYPSAGAPPGGYTAIPAAGNDAQKAGYYTGPYGTSGAAASPYGANAGGAGRAAPNGGYGGAPGGEAPTYTADRRANPYPSTGSPPVGSYSPYGASGGYGAGPAGGAGAPPANFNPNTTGGAPGYAPGGGYGPAGGASNGYAPQGVAPASVPANGTNAGGQWDAEPAQAHSNDSAPSGVVPASPYASRDNGYRPGSTGRGRSAEGPSSADPNDVRPAGYNSQGGSFQGGSAGNPY